MPKLRFAPLVKNAYKVAPRIKYIMPDVFPKKVPYFPSPTNRTKLGMLGWTTLQERRRLKYLHALFRSEVEWKSQWGIFTDDDLKWWKFQVPSCGCDCCDSCCGSSCCGGCNAICSPCGPCGPCC